MWPKAILASALMVPFIATAQWDQYGGVGLNLNTYREDLPDRYNLESDNTLGLTAGWKTIGRWGNIGFRTGAFFEYTRVSIDDREGPNAELKSYYAAIPLNLQLDIVDNLFSVFGGVTPRLLLAKSCRDCGSFDDEGEIFNNSWNAGITWEFNPRWSADFVFHHALTENYKDIKINTAQAVLFYKF